MRVAAANTPGRLAPHNLEPLAKAGADVICAQEHRDGDDWRPKGWKRYRPRVARSNTVYWNPATLTPTGRGHHRLSSPGFRSYREAVWMRFGDVRIISVHLPAFYASSEANRREYDAQVQRLLDFLEPGDVVAGDFNGSVNGARMAPLVRVLDFSDPKRTGPSGQKIDYVASMPPYATTTTTLIPIPSSDHDAIVVTVERTTMVNPMSPPLPVTTPFGKPGSWAAGFHTGDDYACGHRHKIVATAAGTVVTVTNGGGWGSAYGRHVIIDVNGRRAMSAHMDQIVVSRGQRVKAGQLLGYADNTGRSFGTHNHYEERVSPYRYGTDSKKPILSAGGSGGGGGGTPSNPCFGDYCYGKNRPQHRALQRRLSEKGHNPGYGDWPTDFYGDGTKGAVAAFQRAQGWSGSDADGLLGPGTLDRLGLPERLSFRRDKSVYLSKMKVGQGDSDSVWNVQVALLRKGYSIPAGPTDYFGNQTKTAVKKFQEDQGWTGSDADGIPGPGTVKALGLNYIDDRDDEADPKPPPPPGDKKPAAPSFVPDGVTWAPIQKADGSWVTGLRPFAVLDEPAPKIVVHTTESPGKPNWSSLGRGYPHYTADLDDDYDVDMHIAHDMAAFTMAGGEHSPNSAGGVTIQIEVVGYAKDTPNWSQDKCDRLRRLLEDIAADIGMEYVFPYEFGDQAAGTGQELEREWDVWVRQPGIVGHAHAPYQKGQRWDPGELPVEKLTDRVEPDPEPPIEGGALELLLANGWDEEPQDEIDTALAVMFCESGGFIDAVGDLGIINEKWGPSVGLGQVRTLQEVENWEGQPDGVRDIEELRDPGAQVRAIRTLKNAYGWQQWSVHPDSAERKGRDPNGPEYRCFRESIGKDFYLLTGHKNAECWSLDGCPDEPDPPTTELGDAALRSTLSAGLRALARDIDALGE